MAQSSYLSHREKTLSLIAGVLLLAVVAVNYASAQSATGSTTATTNAPPPPPPTETTQAVTADDRQNQVRQLKDQRDYLKNLRREVSDIKREVKTLDTSAIDGHLKKFEECLNTRDVDVGTGDFWDKMQECYDLSRIAEDELKDKIRPIRDCGNFANSAKSRRRELKDNIDRTIKDIKRNDKNADTSLLDAKKTEIESLLGKLEQVSASCTPDTVSDGQSLQTEIDYAFRDWYDISNETNQKSNDARRQTENTRQFEKDIKRQCEKDMGRQLKDFERNFARWQKAGTLPADAEAQAQKVRDAYNELCVTALDTMKQALTSGDMDAFDGARNDFNDRQRDFYDTINEANNVSQTQEQAKNALREITQREKDFKQMQREYERVKKQSGGLGNPDSEKLVSDYAAKLAEAKEAVKTDPNSWWEGYQQDLNDIQNEFWNSFQKVQAVGDVARWLKDNERELKFREKDLKNISRECPEVGEQLAVLLSDARQTIAKIRDLAGSDPEEARNSFYLLDDIRFQWEETQRSCWEGKQMKFEFDRMQQEIKFAKKQVNDLIRREKVSKEEGGACLEFINEVEVRVKNLSSDPTADMEELFEDLEDKSEEVCPFIEKSGERPDHEYYREFIEENVEGIDDNQAASLLEKVSEDAVSKVLQRLLSDPAIIQNLLNAAGDKNRDAVASTLEATTTFYDEKSHADLLGKKAEILELTKQLEGLKLQVQIAQDKLKELEAVRNEISNYNFYGSSGDDIRHEVESFIAEAQTKGLSRDAIRARIDELKTKKDDAIRKSKEDKVGAGIIPFYDTDDNEWFTKFVVPLKAAGIIAGKGDGKFDPNGNVTVAELLTMAFRLSGDKEARGTAKFCGAAGHWANKFVVWAENRGLSIVEKCTDLNRPALRWEVVQVLIETGSRGEVEESREACFTDVKSSDQPVNSVVCAAQKADLMKGENGKANAYNKVNRAQTAVMVRQAAEKLFGISFDEGGDRGGDEGDEDDNVRIKIRQTGEDEGDDDDDDDYDDDFEDDNGDDFSSSSSGKRSRCWWDNQCTDLMSAQLVTPDECEAAGGEGWGPDEDECTAL